MNALRRFALAGGCAVALTGGHANGEAIPVLWGVDEENARLFSVHNYRSALSSYTDYGLLKYDDGGVARSIGGPQMEAFALRGDGTAFMVFNDGLGPFSKPVLLRFNVGGASTAAPNVASIVGRIDVPIDHHGDSIDGLTFQPGTGAMYALFQDQNGNAADRLVTVDPITAAAREVGVISGLGLSVREGKDLVFDGAGNLYVIDGLTDALYRVDPASGAIVEVVDDDLAGGLGDFSGVKFEGLAWDPFNDRLIASEHNHTLFAEITRGHGNNLLLADYSLLGLQDVEGIAFMPVPAPGALALLVLAAAAGRRRRS
jgi:hypothetical protein